MVRVFVYGTLKKGFGNHALMERAGAKFLGYDTISGPFTMVSMGGFPAVCHDDSVVCDQIMGQVYELKQEGLLALDMLEGHPRWYKREKLRTDVLDVRAWIYLMPQSVIKGKELVPGNCWRPTQEEIRFLDELNMESA